MSQITAKRRKKAEPKENDVVITSVVSRPPTTPDVVVTGATTYHVDPSIIEYAEGNNVEAMDEYGRRQSFNSLRCIYFFLFFISYLFLFFYFILLFLKNCYLIISFYFYRHFDLALLSSVLTASSKPKSKSKPTSKKTQEKAPVPPPLQPALPSSATTSSTTTTTITTPATTAPPSTSRSSVFHCAICLGEPDETTTLSSTFCGHIFCASCINLAISKTKKCPTCRKTLTGRGSVIRLYV